MNRGSIQMTNAIWNKPSDPAGQVQVNDGVIRVEMKGRTYFSNTCVPGTFSHSRYAGLNLLNKRISWTTDLAGAGCGCNAAFYLASLPQNPDVSGCKDFYCDANSVCGVRCSEIDLQEANLHAFHSVLHMAEDGSGEGLGYGGGGSGWNSHRDWTKEEYGPGSSCIDTTQPFQVEVSFPVEENLLKAMVTKVSQNGCALEASVETASYSFNDKSSADELTKAFENGMTPIVSYWSAPDMLWMDGKGADGLGPCETDQPDLCGEAVKFYVPGFALRVVSVLNVSLCSDMICHDDAIFCFCLSLVVSRCTCTVYPCFGLPRFRTFRWKATSLQLEI